MEENNEIEIFKKKIQFFNENCIKVHVILKKNNWFYNGFIIEESDDHFIIDDELEGRIPVFFIELKDVIKYKTREEIGKSG